MLLKPLNAPRTRPDVLRRGWAWFVEQIPFVAVLLVLAGAFIALIFAPRHWSRVSGVMGVALLLAGVLRAVVPPRRVGMLAVRARWIDVATYLAVGVAILAVDIRLHV
ncbi:MAG TPA: DUF3017 domain-containing protein [Jatrophihabitans sp.]|nr:DUF3017 domain-containing protein [Jatrophihabitans sp.]